MWEKCQSCLLLCSPVTGMSFPGDSLHCDSRGGGGFTGWGQKCSFLKKIKVTLVRTTGYDSHNMEKKRVDGVLGTSRG